MSNRNRPSSSQLVGWLVVLIVAILAFFVATHQRMLIDYVQAWQYTPSGAMQSIRGQLRLTSEGQLYFDASHPVVQPAASFNESCAQRQETNSPVIGCYSQQRIYVFDVTNDRLEGIEQTTAAHELLHAAYERLDDSERSRVNKLLEAAYDRLETSELRDRMALYKKTEPGQELNELHSILGTEQKQLGSELEAYYAKYFTNRARVVKYYEAYHAVFTSVLNRINDLVDQINSRTVKLNKRIADYNARQTALNSEVEAFNRQADAGSFSSQEAFNTRRQELLGRRDQLNSQVTDIRSEIAAISSLRNEYAGLQKQYEGLTRSINSTLAPVTKLRT